MTPSNFRHQFWLECAECGHRTLFVRPAKACQRCGGKWLDARYDYDTIREQWPAALRERPFDMWRYRELLPLLNDAHKVTQGQWVIDDRVLNSDELRHWRYEEYGKVAAPGILDDSRFVPLSAREMEILQHTARGSSNKEIAHALKISQQTVKNQISSILRKLGVKDRTEAAVYALRHGWIRLEDTKPNE